MVQGSGLETTGRGVRGNGAIPPSKGNAMDSTGPSSIEIYSRNLEAVLGLLSGDDVANVSTAETATALADGEEFLDPQALDEGVKRARGTVAAMGRVLPRKAVHETTWTRILAELRLEDAARATRP
jgi:hypothetical protein